VISRDLLGDPDRIKQILFNLLGNAFKFTENGEIRLLVSCVPIAGLNDVELKLIVADTGIGISAENQTQLFQEFTQVGKSSEHIRGTGLGLAITRNLLSLMNGTITLASELGKGSRFCACIPLKYDESIRQEKTAYLCNNLMQLYYQSRIVIRHMCYWLKITKLIN
jgi:signal transduction histidine kinase